MFTVNSWITEVLLQTTRRLDVGSKLTPVISPGWAIWIVEISSNEMPYQLLHQFWYGYRMAHILTPSTCVLLSFHFHATRYPFWIPKTRTSSGSCSCFIQVNIVVAPHCPVQDGLGINLRLGIIQALVPSIPTILTSQLFCEFHGIQITTLYLRTQACHPQ